ncbi:hypothetical protein [Streptomyces sp. NPDC102283]|uniref:hypothetical protein n=1 Tax=Streptomyces sp. NPDC102283 TaxID=3366155 RepID=UPI00382DA0DC
MLQVRISDVAEQTRECGGLSKSLHTARCALTGRPALLLSRFNLLRQLVREPLQGLTVPSVPVEAAATVHGWVLRHFDYGAPRTQDGWFDWTAFTGQAARKLGTDDATMPHLVVDERQDLSPGFDRLVRIATVSVTVFADGCQRLTETNSTLNEITDVLGRITGRVEIARNHRDSREIASLAEHFRIDCIRPEIPLRNGTLPVVGHCSDTKDLADNIAGLVARLPRDRIGVIVNTKRLDADLVRLLERVGLAHEPSSTARRPRPVAAATSTAPGVVLVHRASTRAPTSTPSLSPTRIPTPPTPRRRL